MVLQQCDTIFKIQRRERACMKALFIGGTGTISLSISRKLLELGWELYLLNRGNQNHKLEGERLHWIQGDIYNEVDITMKIKDLEFDVVCNFIAFVPEDVQRDLRLFSGRTQQYIFISSASAYQKPLSHYYITEGTPLSNPQWQYSRDKIACEDVLMEAYRTNGFPVTIVRPSHTYDVTSIPLGVHGEQGGWQVVQRILEDKPVIIHGDGTSLWTMTHARDFAIGFIGLMGNIHAQGEAVQITSDESLTWNQIYQAIANACNKTLHAVHVSSEFLHAVGPYDFQSGLLGDKANSVVFDNSKIKRLVPEFKGTTRFDQGIRECIAFHLEHPEYQKADEDFDHWCDRVIQTIEESKQRLAKEVSR